MHEWKPIESAPKGDYILGLSVYGVDIFRWDDQRYHQKPNPYWARKWMTRVGFDREFPPTHWMELPESAPPVDEKATQE